MARSRPASETRQLFADLTAQIPWAEQFHRALERTPLAEPAVDRLIREGCDAARLLVLLEMACKDVFTRASSKHRDIAASAVVVARNMLKTATKLQKFESSAGYRDRLQSLRRPEFKGLSENLRVYAQGLLAEKSLFEIGGKLGRESRREVVAWLASHVEGTTGDTHYKEIALLMQAYYAMRGTYKDVPSRGVEKQVKRFREKCPSAYEFMKDIANIEFRKAKGQVLSGDSKRSARSVEPPKR